MIRRMNAIKLEKNYLMYLERQSDDPKERERRRIKNSLMLKTTLFLRIPVLKKANEVIKAFLSAYAQ